ncbi:MAG: type II toxin-antitoxin system VapC family toxin [Cyanobacteria bacterium CAN_BIN43]|nr:type II toxin-antitoxin system VapC family toxin [Cyanobacteria bacterium CAN_BIN43]
MSSCVLDASALLALMNGEAGSDIVSSQLPNAAMLSVNFGEVVAKLTSIEWTESEIRQALGALAIDVMPFDRELAYRSGLLRAQTKSIGLSFGDRACLALGERLGVPVLTSDRAWASLKLNVVITVIR